MEVLVKLPVLQLFMTKENDSLYKNFPDFLRKNLHYLMHIFIYRANVNLVFFPARIIFIFYMY